MNIPPLKDRLDRLGNAFIRGKQGTAIVMFTLNCKTELAYTLSKSFSHKTYKFPYVEAIKYRNEMLLKHGEAAIYGFDPCALDISDILEGRKYKHVYLDKIDLRITARLATPKNSNIVNISLDSRMFPTDMHATKWALDIVVAHRRANSIDCADLLSNENKVTERIPITKERIELIRKNLDSFHRGQHSSILYRDKGYCFAYPDSVKKVGLNMQLSRRFLVSDYNKYAEDPDLYALVDCILYRNERLMLDPIPDYVKKKLSSLYSKSNKSNDFTNGVINSVFSMSAPSKYTVSEVLGRTASLKSRVHSIDFYRDETETSEAVA